MKTATIRAVSCAAPGLPDWNSARAVLAGKTEYEPTELGKLAPAWLPANERRRLSPVMRLALTVGERALEAADCSRQRPASVFASACGDGDIIHAICEELARGEPSVSPTQFHNSVHNAPAGYWAIASGARTASTTITAHDASFAASWIEALLIAETTQAPVLLVAYDQPLPPPLNDKRHLPAPFACALLVDTHPESDGIARIETSVGKDAAESRLEQPALEALRRGNPAARALPLLALLAQAKAGAVILPWPPNSTLTLRVTT